MKRLNKQAILENVDLKPLFTAAESAMSEYIRKAAMQQLEKNPKWNHDFSDFDITFSNVIENNNRQFREFCEYLIDEEIEAVVEDYPYDRDEE